MMSLADLFRTLGQALRLAFVFAGITVFMVCIIALTLFWRLVNLPLDVWRRRA